MKTGRIQEKAAAIAILQYLRDHPRAKDSAQGIARWWVHEKHEVVVRALRLLVKEGVVEKERQIYRLAPSAGMPNAARDDSNKTRQQPRKGNKSS